MNKNEEYEFCIFNNSKENKKEFYIKNICEFWHIASFENFGQVRKFFKKFNIKIVKIQTFNKDYKSFLINKNFNNHIGFWKLSELPQNTIKYKALSNGSIVDCYYTINNNIVNIYRPNPNAKEVYKPLSLLKHIEHKKKYGIY